MLSRKASIQNLLIAHLKDHSSIYMFTIILFSIGVIFGAIVVNSLSFIQKEDLFYYISDFFSLILTNEINNNQELFLQSLFHNSKVVILIWGLGISIIGLPLTLALLFMKGMVVGFTVGFLVNQMGFKGFLLSFSAILPQNFVIIPVFIITATLSITLTLKMIRKHFMKTNNEVKPLIVNYTYSLLFLLSFLLLGATLEAYLSPFLMKIVLSIVS